jgi:hypothetical protein
MSERCYEGRKRRSPASILGRLIRAVGSNELSVALRFWSYRVELGDYRGQ